jgi:hypothetical protein
MEHAVVAGVVVFKTLGFQEVALADGLNVRVTFASDKVKTGQIKLRDGNPFLDTPSSLLALKEDKVRFVEIEQR